MKAVVNGKQTEVTEIEINNQSVDSLSIGTPAGVLLKDLEKSDIQKGDIYFTYLELRNRYYSSLSRIYLG